MLVKDFLLCLVSSSEKAANIAREIRSDSLFASLVEDKESQDGRADFKTLADVLIQEVVKHDVSTQFPSIKDNIFGEETTAFTNKAGQTIHVAVGNTMAETESFLDRVFPKNHTCAQRLAAIIHEETTLPVGQVSNRELTECEVSLNDADVGLWIDPIDSTFSYLQGIGDDKPVNGIYHNGLQCCSVLIGAYSLSSGLPFAGVINQPFHRKENSGWISQATWGIHTPGASFYSLSTRDLSSPASRIIMSSRRMAARYTRAIRNAGFTSREPKGAGYKLLTVIEGDSTAFVVDPIAILYRWDSCGPHGILRALGGGAVDVVRYEKAFFDGGTAASQAESRIAANSSLLSGAIKTESNGEGGPLNGTRVVHNGKDGAAVATEDDLKVDMAVLGKIADACQIDYAVPHTDPLTGESTWANIGGMIAYTSLQDLAVVARLMRSANV